MKQIHPYEHPSLYLEGVELTAWDWIRYWKPHLKHQVELSAFAQTLAKLGILNEEYPYHTF